MAFNFEIGKTYLVTHSRKGSFIFRVAEQRNQPPQFDTFVSGYIEDGMAEAIFDYNEKHVGEYIEMRRSLIQKATEMVKVGGVWREV